jgi:5-formyltetrahydrofolate cyclo-ligase
MSDGIPAAKAVLRKEFRERIKNLSPEERSSGSVRIRQRLAERPVWHAAQAVLFYVPTPAEPDLWPLVAEALGAGKSVALPRYSPTERAYTACLIRDASHDLEPGRFGILEPTAGCPVFNLKQLDLALVPGIGFSVGGCRLGRGKGYYDRLLAGLSAFKCGVAFDCQVADEFPVEPHDVRLNCILTPERWHEVVGQPRF